MHLRAITLGTFLWCSCLALATLACNKSEQASGDKAAAKQEYTVKGQVKSIETKDGETTLLIHHEEIPDFVDRKGNKSGMISMSMPFGVAKGVSTDGLAVDEKVEFVFSVDWERKPMLEISKLSKLPADAPLNLTGQ